MIGDFITRVLRGGSELSAVTLTRFFSVHIWILPALFAAIIGTHVYLVIRLGESTIPKEGE